MSISPVIFSNLSLEIVNIILSYAPIVRYRTGKYIDGIAENDSRIPLLMNMPIKHYFYWPGGNVVSTVTLHVSPTKYISIDHCDGVLSISASVHSGIDYQKSHPGDEDESTLLLYVEKVVIK